MVNHTRTLLLNLKAADPPGVGEEYVPPDFNPVELPQTLRAARAALFGPAPTRTDLNLILARLLAFAHGCELADVLKEKDPRISYNPAAPAGTTAGLVVPPAYAFAAAAAGFPNDETVFVPAAGVSTPTDIRLSAVWDSAAPAPLRAVALALALAARTAEIGGY